MFARSSTLKAITYFFKIIFRNDSGFPYSPILMFAFVKNEQCIRMCRKRHYILTVLNRQFDKFGLDLLA